MDKERHLMDLISEFHKEKMYHDTLLSKAASVSKNMKEILIQMEDIEDDEIR